MKKVLKALLDFRKKRNWQHFHSPQNIAKSIVLEAAEILEIFQWQDNSNLTTIQRRNLAEEIADVYNWLLLLSHDLNIDIEKEALQKVTKNQKRYPINKIKGKARKYIEL